MVWGAKNVQTTAVISVVIFILGVALFFTCLPYLPLSTASNFEGPKTMFTGVEWYNTWYPGTGTFGSTLNGVSMTEHYDFDGVTGTTVGSITTTRDSDGKYLEGFKISTSGISGATGQPTGPEQAYTWDIVADDGSKDIFRMELWKLHWTVNAWSVTNNWADGCEWSNLKVWIRVTLNDGTWYFDNNPDQVYFAVAAIEVDNWTRISEEGTIRTTQVSPSSQGELLTLDNGESGDPTSSFYSYQGHALNPDMFRPYVNTWLSFDDFGPSVKVNLLGQIIGGADASVQWRFNVWCFVVGQWHVLPGYSGDAGQHNAGYDVTGNAIADWINGVLAGMGQWFANPLNAIAFWLIIVVIVVLILALTGVLAPIVQAATASKRRVSR